MVLQEGDDELKYRIRPISLVMHNPNFFWLNPYDASSVLSTFGGVPTVLSAATGAGVSVAYYKFSTQAIPSTFYANIWRTWGRLFIGAAIGGAFGFMRFGDRQRLHNAYTSYRVRRRYKDSINIETKDIWRFKGHKPHEEFYQWQ